ncbi:flavodoxin family protein [Desulfospira joergensenii]|uniref:flavodoxin family protein n=1 Tax=Desulfospira joergensenii TaxID=53329 RepID=UPI0003B7AF27|nr:flavodoxin family protein [Desulfospira joergensenii]
MKTLIVYSTQSGNTLKLAETIFETLDGEKDMLPVDQAQETEGYDMVAVGFWFMAGKPDPKSQEFLSGLKSGTRLFLFATHGAARDSDHVKTCIQYAAGLTDNADIAGVFTCQGEVNPNVLEKVSQKAEPPAWLKDASDAVGHPDEADLRDLAGMIKKL